MAASNNLFAMDLEGKGAVETLGGAPHPLVMVLADRFLDGRGPAAGLPER
jgi:hypothetical protein